MEEKVYQRTVTKLAISHRVVDKHQITRHYKSVDLEALYDCKPNAGEERPTNAIPDDKMLATLILELPYVFSCHEHQRLLQNRPEDNLNEAELTAAWEEFQVNRNQQNQLQQQQQLFQNQQRQLQYEQQQQQQHTMNQQTGENVHANKFYRQVIVKFLGNISVAPTLATTSTTATMNGHPSFADGFNIGRSHLNQVANKNITRTVIENLDRLKQYFNPKPK